MHAQQHAKKYFKFFNASDQEELRPNPCRTRHQAGPCVVRCTQLQILLSACQISKFQNSHSFLNSHQPKGCFFFYFCQKKIAFLAPPARCGSNEYHVHRSEVNIYRVMTRNESRVRCLRNKEESTLPTPSLVEGSKFTGARLEGPSCERA